MPNDFIVVFDISDVGYKALPFVAFGLLFVLLGVLMFVFPNALPFRGPRLLKKPFKYLFLGFSVLWTTLAFSSTYKQYRLAKNAATEHHFKVVEGLVRDFKPMPYSGHSMERFCVEEACFEYSDYVVTSGFNNTASHGGPIRDGLPVRVSYIGNTIIRLEVAKSTP